MDEVAEWLRRWTANPMESVRVGSNPILVVDFAQKAFRFDYVILAKVGLSELKNLRSFILIFACILVKKVVRRLIINVDACRCVSTDFVIRFCR